LFYVYIKTVELSNTWKMLKTTQIQHSRSQAITVNRVVECSESRVLQITTVILKNPATMHTAFLLCGSCHNLFKNCSLYKAPHTNHPTHQRRQWATSACNTAGLKMCSFICLFLVIRVKETVLTLKLCYSVLIWDCLLSVTHTYSTFSTNYDD